MPAAPTNALSSDEKQLVIAMALMQKALSDNSLATAANTHTTEDDYRKRAKDIEDFTAGLKPSGGAAPLAPGDGAPGGSAPPAAAKAGDGAAGGSAAPAAAKADDDLLAAILKDTAAKPKDDGVEELDDAAKEAAGALAEFQKKLGEDYKNDATASRGRGTPGLGQRAGAAAGGAAGAVGSGALGAVTNVLSSVAGKFAAIAGPAAILSQVLQNSLSGFQVLNQAVKVVATTLAPILLPVTVALAAGMLAISDVLIEQLLPGMDRWFQLILDTAIPVISAVVDAFAFAADKIMSFASAVGDVIDWVKRQVNSLNPFSDDDDGEQNRADLIAPDAGGRDKVNSGLRDTLASLRNSMGPKASIGALGSVGQAAQMAALNSDPIEARMLKIQTNMLTRLDQVAANTAKTNAAPRPGFRRPGATGFGDAIANAAAEAAAAARFATGDFGGDF